MDVTHKKTWLYKEAERYEKRQRKFLKSWYNYAPSGKAIVYADESAFELHACRQYS